MKNESLVMWEFWEKFSKIVPNSRQKRNLSRKMMITIKKVIEKYK